MVKLRRKECFQKTIKKGLTDMKLCFTLQKHTASWQKLWDMFRKEMEIHHLYVEPFILSDMLLC